MARRPAWFGFLTYKRRTSLIPTIVPASDVARQARQRFEVYREQKSKDRIEDAALAAEVTPFGN
jgi:hypothetical protein